MIKIQTVQSKFLIFHKLSKQHTRIFGLSHHSRLSPHAPRIITRYSTLYPTLRSILQTRVWFQSLKKGSRHKPQNASGGCKGDSPVSSAVHTHVLPMSDLPLFGTLYVHAAPRNKIKKKNNKKTSSAASPAYHRTSSSAKPRGVWRNPRSFEEFKKL